MNDVRKGCTSASNALADSLCKGRHLAQAGLPDSSNKYSDFGSKVHAALAQEIKPDTLTFEQREVFDACKEMEKKALIDYFGEQPPLPIRVIREKADGTTRLWVRFQHEGRLLEHSGQPDVIFRSGTRALIVEYKALLGDVPDSPKNLQLRDQAALTFGNHTLLEEIATTVAQPLASHTVELCVYDRDALARAQAEMMARVIASNDPNSPRTAGKAQCEHCKAKRLCTTYQAWAAQMTPPAMLEVMEVPMAEWTPAQRAHAASQLGPAEKFLDDLRAFLKDGLKQDASFCPGWTLAPGAKRETIVDPQVCFDRFSVIGGKLPEFMKVVSVPKTKLREAVASVTGAKGKKLEQVMKEITLGIVEEKQNEPSLARVKEDAK